VHVATFEPGHYFLTSFTAVFFFEVIGKEKKPLDHQSPTYFHNAATAPVWRPPLRSRVPWFFVGISQEHAARTSSDTSQA
jgi:hypothetical protein